MLDNCNIHHSEEVRALVEDDARVYMIQAVPNKALKPFLECKILFLPPYSPDLNPIEQAFSSIKNYLRRYCNDYTFSVIDRTCQNVSSDQARGFFRASGYVV